jgi:hypothetical protein
MKNTTKFAGVLTMLAMALAMATVSASAQLNSNTGTVTINANLPESLTVNLTNPTITIPLTSNTAVNNSTAPVAGTAIQTAWVLQPGRTAVKVFVYSTVANPLSNGTDTIPATSILISNTGQGGAYSALAAGTPFGTGLQIGASTAITGANKSSSRTDTIFFQINTTFNPQLSAGLYTGTLNVQAQATP